MSGWGSAVPIPFSWRLPEAMEIRGPLGVSKRTVVLASPVLPPVSVATTERTLSPGASGTPAATKERLATVAGRPFTVTVAWAALTVPATMSLTRPVTVTVESRTVEPSGGYWTAR